MCCSTSVMIAPMKSCWWGQMEVKLRVYKGMKVLEEGLAVPTVTSIRKH